MPTIAIVDGIKIQMFYTDHPRAHFHASLAGDEALITILSLDVMRSSLPSSRLRRVLAWRPREPGRAGAELGQMPGRTAAGEDLAMPQVLNNVITHAVADPVTHSVTLTWGNGATTVNFFGHLVGRGVFAALADAAVFAQVRVGERGRSLEWPGEIDFCADALWFETHPEDAPNQASMEHAR